MPETPSVLRQTDDAARALARDLILSARVAALAFTDPETSLPFVSRIAVAPSPPGSARPCIVTLVSDLSLHTRALAAAPDAALLIGDPPARGDPLNHPRIGLSVRAVPAPEDDRAALRAFWLVHHPKARAYIGFTDFRFLYLRIRGGALTAGFARAFSLTAEDLALP